MASSATPDASGKDATPNGALEGRKPMVVTGTGALIGAPTKDNPDAAATASPKNAPVDGFQLDFTDLDIGAVVSAVLGKGLNLPYVIDPQVKGNLTLQSSQPLGRNEILAALEAALRTQGVALVNADGVYHIVPRSDAARQISGLRVPGQGARGFGVYVVPLQYVSADEMQKVLQPFAPEGGIVRVDSARNLLLLSGTSQEMATLLNVIKTFDVDWLAGMSFALYPLEYVDPKTLASEIGEVFTDAKSPIAGLVRFVPLSRLNALMVVTPQPKYLKEVESWIRRLDLGVPTSGRRIYVYDVQNAKADDLAASLSQILSIPTSTPSGGAHPGGLTANTGAGFGSSGSLGYSGTGIGGTTQLTSSPTSPSSFTSGTSLQNSPSGALPYAPASGQAGSEPNALKIVPNADNNSLLVYATPSEYAVIEAAVKRLDTQPIQVLIEASIAEITLNDQLQYGLQWNYKSPQGPITFSQSSSGAIAQQFPGFAFLYSGSANISAVLNSLESITNVRVLSAPKLVVLNNHEADLEVGDQVPIVTQSSVSTVTTGAPIVNSVQLLDTGVILHVTPRANKSGRVLLDVAQEVSDVVPTTTSNIDSPTIEQRKIASTVEVRDGETVALGGLIQNSHSRSRAGLPLLSRIPVLGGLFGSTNHNVTRTELVVLITPHVVRTDDESEAMMDDLHQQFRSLQELAPEWTRNAHLPAGPANHDAPQTPSK